MIKIYICIIIVFSNLIFTISKTTQAVKLPPTNLLNGYSLNNTIPIEYFYVDDSNNGIGTHYIYSIKGINSLIQGAIFLFNKINTNIIQLKEKEIPLQPSILVIRLPKDQWIYLAILIIDDNSTYVDTNSSLLMNAKVGVFGSTEPWVEALSLSKGIFIYLYIYIYLYYLYYYIRCKIYYYY
jgi:hypothetical protein